MMNILIIGCGYVGLTTGLSLAYIGNDVTFLDVNTHKIEELKKDNLTIMEKGLEQILVQTKDSIRFVSSWHEIDKDLDLIMITVGTPSEWDRSVNTSYIESVARDIGKHWDNKMNGIVVIKSTVPVSTSLRVKDLIESELKDRNIVKEVDIVSNPEFLREGEALIDTFYPDRIVIGVNSEHAKNVMMDLYRPIMIQDFVNPASIIPKLEKSKPEVLITDQATSELIKYAANSFLAMKISFINEFSRLSEYVGADIKEVSKGIGLDNRIGLSFLNAGIGWGGSCFGKDTSAILHTANRYNLEMPLVNATIMSNNKQKQHVILKLKKEFVQIRDAVIGIMGLSFKPGTDDLRDAPSIEIIRDLLMCGATVKVYDPFSMSKCQKEYPELNVIYCNKIEQLFDSSDAVLLVTEWDEFLNLPISKLANLMNKKLIIDGRNALRMDEFMNEDIIYRGIGRS